MIHSNKKTSILQSYWQKLYMKFGVKFLSSKIERTINKAIKWRVPKVIDLKEEWF